MRRTDTLYSILFYFLLIATQYTYFVAHELFLAPFLGSVRVPAGLGKGKGCARGEAASKPPRRPGNAHLSPAAPLPSSVCLQGKGCRYLTPTHERAGTLTAYVQSGAESRYAAAGEGAGSRAGAACQGCALAADLERPLPATSGPPDPARLAPRAPPDADPQCPAARTRRRPFP